MRAVGLIVAACLVLGAGCRSQPPLEAPGPAVQVEPTGVLDTTPVPPAADVDAVAEFASPYDAHRWLSGALADGVVDDRVFAALPLVIADPARLDLAVALARDRQHDPEVASDLHALLVREPADPDVLHGYLAAELELALAQGRAGRDVGPVYAWRASYPLEAALVAYEAVGDDRFLVLARDTMLEMLEQRDDVTGRRDEHRGRVLRAWGTDSRLGGDRYANVVTHAGRIAAPMAWYAWLVDADPTLAAAHGTAARTLLTAAEDALLEFEDEFVVSEDGSLGAYWRATHDRIEPLNHQTSVGEALLYLAQVSDDPRWSRRADQLARFVRRAMIETSEDTLVWHYRPSMDDPRKGPPEPIWKGQVTIRFLRTAERFGVVFDRTELEAVARSVRRHVLRDGREFNASISEVRDPLLPDAPYGGVVNLVPYLLLGDHDAELEEQLLEIVARDPQIGGWLGSPKGAAVYATRLAVGERDLRPA